MRNFFQGFHKIAQEVGFADILGAATTRGRKRVAKPKPKELLLEKNQDVDKLRSGAPPETQYIRQKIR